MERKARRDFKGGTNKYVPSANRRYGAGRREIIQACINCIQKRLQSNEIEEVEQRHLSVSSVEELQETLRSLLTFATSTRTSSFQWCPTVLPLYLWLQIACVWKDWSASVQWYEDYSSVWVEPGNHQRSTFYRIQIHWCCELRSSTSSGQVPNSEKHETDSAAYQHKREFVRKFLKWTLRKRNYIASILLQTNRCNISLLYYGYDFWLLTI